MFKRKKNKKIVEVLSVPKTDRRTLSNVPDPEKIRVTSDRRGSKQAEAGGREAEPDFVTKLQLQSLRYMADFDVWIAVNGRSRKSRVKARAVDISSTGLLVELDSSGGSFREGFPYSIRFEIPPGTMPEGFESKVRMEATVIRTFIVQTDEGERLRIAFEFAKPLPSYFQKKR